MYQIKNLLKVELKYVKLLKVSYVLKLLYGKLIHTYEPFYTYVYYS